MELPRELRNFNQHRAEVPVDRPDQPIDAGSCGLRKGVAQVLAGNFAVATVHPRSRRRAPRLCDSAWIGTLTSCDDAGCDAAHRPRLSVPVPGFPLSIA